jgi:hypothetical protein
VKLKSKRPRPEKKHPRKVERDVVIPQGEVSPPTEHAADLLAQLSDAKVNLVSAMKDFNKLVAATTLPENKSENDKKNEQSVIQNLVISVRGVEVLSPTEGVLGMCVFAVRQALSLRDAGNKLAYEFHKLSKRIDQIETDLYEPADED